MEGTRLGRVLETERTNAALAWALVVTVWSTAYLAGVVDVLAARLRE